MHTTTEQGCAEEIYTQMQWIARGVALTVHQYPALKTIAESQMLLDDYYMVSNSTVHSIASGQSIDYEGSVLLNIFSVFTTSNYDNSYFFSFSCNDCVWNTLLYSPNIDHVDSSSTLYIAASVEDADIIDSLTSTWAYYMNGGQIDSVTIDQDFLDSNYVWFVISDADCSPGGSGEPVYKRGPCNSNGICEKDLGEDIHNCDDCNPTPSLTLELMEYELLTDFKNCSTWPSDNYEEGWMQSKYEIAMQYLVYDNIASGSTPAYLYQTSYRTRKIGGNLEEGAIQNDYWDLWWLNEVSARFKNGVKQCKYTNGGCTSFKCNNGKHHLFDDNIVLTFNYDPANSVVYVLMYESDSKDHDLNKELLFETPDFVVDAFNPPPGAKLTMIGQSKSQRDPYTKNGSSLALRLDNTTTWTTETIGGVVWHTFETTLNGELRVKFGYH